MRSFLAALRALWIAAGLHILRQSGSSLSRLGRRNLRRTIDIAETNAVLCAVGPRTILIEPFPPDSSFRITAHANTKAGQVAIEVELLGLTFRQYELGEMLVGEQMLQHDEIPVEAPWKHPGVILPDRGSNPVMTFVMWKCRVCGLKSSQMTARDRWW